MAALKFALNRLPAQTFATTRSAIEVQADVAKALISDSLTHDFPAITEYVAAMEASSASGGSATQSLSELTHAMLKARSFEQSQSPAGTARNGDSKWLMWERDEIDVRGAMKLRPQ